MIMACFFFFLLLHLKHGASLSVVLLAYYCWCEFIHTDYIPDYEGTYQFQLFAYVSPILYCRSGYSFAFPYTEWIP